MLSEYVVNYGGRYVKQIKNVFESLNGAPEQVEAGEEKTNVAKPITIPNHFSEFIVQRPYAYFNLELKDLLSFGLSQTDIASCVNNKRAARRRVQLTEKLTSVEKGSGEAAARVSHVDRFRRLLELYDQNMQRQIRYTALNDYTKVTDTTNRNQKRDLRGPPFVITPLNTPPTVFNLHNYHHLLMRLTTHYTWNPILQYTAVHTIDYQMYIALIAQCALLLFFEDTFLPRSGTEGQQRLPSPMVQVLGQLPPLRYNFHNEFNFSEEFKGPEHPSRSRYWLGTGDWAMRIGKTSGGHLNKQSPGMHPARLAAILAQPNVRKFLVDYSLKEGVSQEVLEKRAKAILLRIGDTLSHRDLRTSGVIVRALLTNVYSRVNMEEFGYLRLRRLFQIPRTQIVLIPLHRSYVDFQIMSYLLGAMCLPYCHIVAGEDFLKMGKLADIMRGSGAFFMRRTFRGDPMYGLLFREYVRQLVLHQQTMEFFIEGTRSRTGKTMTPKLGILKFITDAFFGNGQNDLDDVLFVPVSLSYDELLEGGLYAKELLGVPKPPESITNMIKAGMALRGDLHGCINLRIGHTISLRRLSVHLDECPAPFQPRTELPKESPTPPAKSTTSPALLTRLGWRITYELQRNIVISPSALVASLLECLGPLEDTPDEKRSRMGTTCLTLSTLEKNVEWLKECIKARKGRLQDDVLSSSTARITTVGVTRLRKFAKLHTDGPFPHVTLHPKDSLVARVGVNISTNQLIHIFVDEALVSVVSHAYGNFTPVPSPSGHTNKKMPYGVRVVKKEVMENTCHWLQLMLATEFPNYSRYCPYSFDSWMSCVLHRMRTSGEEERQVLQQCGGEAGNGGAVVVPVTRLYYFTAQLLFPHIEALYVVLLTIEILFSTFKDSNRLPAKTVAAAAFNSYKLCFENSPSGDGEGSGGRLVEYIVAGNKETLQHYFQSAIELQFIRLVRGEGDTIFYALNDGRMEEGYGGKFQGQNGLERVARLIQQVQALRHHPSTEAGPKKKLQSII
ncbi:glyceronephosphate O-acyltransferase [Angomonas deanei]|uniref:Acyltransferase, putative n=1 Tax=Angomonas deanei TaxID=59799 RepID=A0A7G2C8F1_9TRYP|nr:glyceronephosphate O-acyltransferase [Angomonas deanei]CAD2215725.1 Acyltransferase, putative [Angomonas deanei]|eukprot:EPY26863.1 glyceronephosphate O-acyltransferase [Angomonas deanei]